YETRIVGLDRYDYNLFVIAARDAATPENQVPEQRSIAGRFALITDDPSGPPGDVRPSTLPNTGEAPAGPPWGRIITTAGVMAGAAFVVFGVRRSARRRRTA